MGVVFQNTGMANSLLDLTALMPSWELSMRAEHKAKGTIKAYGDGVRDFLRWCGANGVEPELTRVKAQAFVGDLLQCGVQPATAHLRLKGLRGFSAWLASEGELDVDALAGVKSPRLDQKVIPE